MEKKEIKNAQNLYRELLFCRQKIILNGLGWHD